MTCLRAFGGLVLAASLAAAAPVGETLETIATRPGVTQPFLFLRPPRAPVASVVLLAGGAGRLGLAGYGPGWVNTNFLVRNRARFAERGFLVAVPDAPSDRPQGLDGVRSNREHAEDIRALIAWLRRAAPVPVWLVGTSMGTVSAASAAARLGAEGPDGLVLTSTVTRRSRGRGESTDDVPLADIGVPTLVVHHKDDGCPFTPYGDTALLVRALRHAPRRELLTFEGGDPPRSAPCEPLAPHGYLGLDERVVEAIAAWIAAAPAR